MYARSIFLRSDLSCPASPLQSVAHIKHLICGKTFQIPVRSCLRVFQRPRQEPEPAAAAEPEGEEEGEMEVESEEEAAGDKPVSESGSGSEHGDFPRGTPLQAVTAHFLYRRPFGLDSLEFAVCDGWTLLQDVHKQEDTVGLSTTQ